MILTDTHTHLYTEQFDDDRHEMIQRAISEGVKRFFIPAIDSTYQERMEDLAATYPENVFLMAGLHPTHVKEDYEEELSKISKLLEKGVYYGVGETGIDLYWDKTFLKEQQIAFKRQIRLAKQYNLPIIIHCREAFDEVFEVLELEKEGELRGIFHCFTGNREQAKKAINYNLKLGIGGVATFKNGKIDQFLKEIDINHIVLETDAPYLAPVPFRGKRNESSYLKLVAKKISEIYGISIEEVAHLTTENSKEVFGV
ncbi:TatD family hydrolase [Ascidiimonas sp. W6]|uniref:TatD family hydrolase n=1 Tax=Ascidiimonas meishanensis TaxID=3128903 RepID=UPI0030EB626C